MAITVNQSLIPNAAGAPLDARTQAANTAALTGIDNPYVGMKVWLADPGKEVIVKTVTTQQVGLFTKTVIAAVEDVPDKTALDGKASASSVSALAGRVTDADEAIAALGDSFSQFDAQTAVGVTKFEVYATNAVIPAGTTDADTGLAYAVDVPAGMTHHFRLRSDSAEEDCDIVIEWGDNHVTAIAEGDSDSVNDSEWLTAGELIFNVSHTYATPGKYIVTVRGADYWGMQTNSANPALTPSILSRMFAEDLPVSRSLQNLAGCCANSPKLQSLLIPTGMDLFVNIHNASSIFMNCVNLLSAVNFETKFQWTRYIQNMFKGCSHLVACDFRMPQTCIRPNAYTAVYQGCTALTARIQDLLPERGFDGKNVDISNCFSGCAALTGTVPASVLWNDMVINWTHANTFKDCPAAILSQVPESWGGTGSEVEDPRPITRRNAITIIQAEVDDAMQSMSIPSGANAGRGNVLGGYGVQVAAVATADAGATQLKLTLANFEALDWDKITADIPVRVNDPGATVTIPAGEDETEEDLLYLEATIAAVDAEHGYVWLTPWRYAGSDPTDFENERAVSSDFASAVTDGKIFLRIADGERTDAAASSGDKNFVTGIRAYANGSWNTVTGLVSGADGSLNVVTGDLSFAKGVSNVIQAESAAVTGIGNTVGTAAGLSIIIGCSNEPGGQSQYIIGDSNRTSGVGQIVIGNTHTGAGNRSIFIGQRNDLSGAEGLAIGYGLKIQGRNGMLVGRYGILTDAAENKDAFAIAAGAYQAEALPWIFRANKAVVNPLFDPLNLAEGSSLSDPNPKDAAGETKYTPERAYSFEYRGHFRAVTKTTADTGVVTLDHDFYARWILTASGAVTLALANWKDGDIGEIIVNTSNTSVTLPASWIIPEDFDITTTAGIYALELEQVGESIYCHVRCPFGGSGIGHGNEITISDAGTWVIDSVDTGKPSRGAAFTYADFTAEQLAALIGPMGPKGDAFVYDDFTEEQLEALKVKGDPGTSVTHSWDGTILTVTSASGTTSSDLKGERGTDAWIGTQAEYDAITIKDNNRLYLITDI